MSGVELGERLHGVQDLTPIVFITAHDDPHVRAQALAMHCAGYFQKTAPGNLVLDAVRRAAGLLESPGSSSPSDPKTL
jgi:DNA-binding NarL/FixJ family response regulator